MVSKNMAAVESTRTSSKIKGQYKNMKSLLGGIFFFSSLFIFFLLHIGNCKRSVKMMYENIDWNEMWKERGTVKFKKE